MPLSRNWDRNRLGYFISDEDWLDASALLEKQIREMKRNRHFRTPSMLYYDSLPKDERRTISSVDYFEQRVANNLFYGLENEFHWIPYSVPKGWLGLRNYKFLSYPLRLLYYAVGIYLLRLTEGASKGCKATPCGYLRHADWPAISAGARGVASVALRPRTRDPCPSLARKKGYQARQKVPKRSSDIGSGPVRMMPSSLAVSKTHCELPALVAADFHANVQAHAAPWKFTYNLWMHPALAGP